MAEKLLIIAILALLLAACANGPSTTGPVQPKSAGAEESSSTSSPADAATAERKPNEEDPAESNEGPSVDEKDEEKDGRPERIVLKTVYDDRQAGEEEQQAIEAELGLIEDETLLEFIRSVGIRLLRYAPPRPFDYEFKIVDQRVPNAFALPGGKIYLSRGLLALVQSEDELAGIIGHEITHAAERHIAARMDYASRLNPLSIGFLRAATIAAYGRDQERDADRGGQIMAARAGYDPSGIATFLRKLDAADRYEIGWSRLPHFLSTHPTSPERSALASNRAASLEWERQAGVSDDLPLAYYSAIDGIILGDNPAGGLFEGSRFVHPDLRFTIRFPQGWKTINSHQAVGAVSPNRDAEATLTIEGEGTDIARIVDEFIAKKEDGIRVKVRERRAIKIGGLPAIRIEGRTTNGLIGLSMQMTFVAYQGFVYRLSLLSLAGREDQYRGRARAFAHSFRPMDDAAARSFEVTRLRIALAIENETLESLSLRTHNDLELVYTGVMNDLFAETSLAKGAAIKIGLAEPYIPKPKKDADETEGP